MSIVAIGAVIIGATEEAAIVVLLFLIDELLEGIAPSQACASITGLADLMPKTAFLLNDDSTSEVPAASLTLGAIIMVHPGERIPTDSLIIADSSAIDELPVTGKSMPRARQPGDAVFAGTINTDAVLWLSSSKPSVSNMCRPPMPPSSCLPKDCSQPDPGRAFARHWLCRCRADVCRHPGG
ncbi:MAG: hypothetical protein MO846_09430 [Candidatus Devosia symbiotica]|nr:hypothetical protein [Candidatus Devosia symbiotica]